jgi:hypothetical protein
MSLHSATALLAYTRLLKVKKMVANASKLTLRTAFTAKLVISKTQPRILLG